MSGCGARSSWPRVAGFLSLVELSDASVRMLRILHSKLKAGFNFGIERVTCCSHLVCGIRNIDVT